MAPARNATSSAAHMRRAFARDFAHRAQVFHKLASKYPLTADDVHDLRVTTRRLRASIAVLRHAGVRAKTARARETLRALGRLLGECRMLDVAIEDARRYRVSAVKLEPRRNRAYTALRRALAPARVDTLNSLLDHIQETISGAHFEKLAKRLERSEREVDTRLARAAPRGPRARHELRIEMKKVRYFIEAFGRRSPSMRRLQDGLGREHDLSVLQSMTGPIPAAARDERRERARADRVRDTALRAAKIHLRAIRTALKR